MDALKSTTSTTTARSHTGDGKGAGVDSSNAESTTILNLAKRSDPFETKTMPPRKIHLHLVRHGETIANANGVLQGHCDYPLTDLGKQQADACGVYLKDMKWDKVYASDLYRAYDTCQLVLKHSEYSKFINRDIIERTTLLRELSFGVREGLPRSTPFDEAVKHVAKTLNIPEEAVEDSTESDDAVYRRQVKFISTLLRDLVLENSGANMGSDEVLVVDARKGRSSKGSKKKKGKISKENTSDDDDDDPNKPMEVLCLTHGNFIKHFLRNFCASSLQEFPSKIWNCAISSLTVEWPDPNQPMGFIVTTKQSKVNVNTLEAVANMKTNSLSSEDATVVSIATDLVGSEK